MWVAFLIGVGTFVVLLGGFILALMLGVIAVKAAEPPDRGERTDYRLEQGREVDARSPSSVDEPPPAL